MYLGFPWSNYQKKKKKENDVSVKWGALGELTMTQLFEFFSKSPESELNYMKKAEHAPYLYRA